MARLEDDRFQSTKSGFELKSIRHPATSILCQGESIVYRTKSIVFLTKSIVHRTKSTVHRTKFVVLRLKSIVLRKGAVVFQEKSIGSRTTSIVDRTTSIVGRKKDVRCALVTSGFRTKETRRQGTSVRKRLPKLCRNLGPVIKGLVIEMRTSLSPLIREIESHLHASFDGIVVRTNLGGDGLIVHVGERTFAIQPPLVASNDSEASWPIYVVPVPAPERKSWECTSLEDVIATLASPEATPSVRLVRLEDVRRGLVLAEEEVARRRGAA